MKSKNIGELKLRDIFYITLILISFSSSTISVRDNSGKLVGKIQGENVYDESGKLLGKIKNGSTYDSKGRRLLDKELPGYLLKK